MKTHYLITLWFLFVLSLPAAAQTKVFAERFGQNFQTGWSWTFKWPTTGQLRYDAKQESAGLTVTTKVFSNLTGYEVIHYAGWSPWTNTLTQTACAGLVSNQPDWFGVDVVPNVSYDAAIQHWAFYNFSPSEVEVHAFADSPGFPDFNGDNFKMSPYSSVTRQYHPWWSGPAGRWTDLTFGFTP